MVLLTMTAAMVEALGKLGAISSAIEMSATGEADPTLSSPTIGNPISHVQVIHISRQMKSSGLSPSHLDTFLRGSQVYNPPPTPKPEPTSEYKALMARLRREEESRIYERMTNDRPLVESFSSRIPTSSAAHAFSSTADYIPTSENDDMTYADIDRQLMLIFNVLISVFACAAALWTVARWWSTPARLALSMSGSVLVGVAEVVVYTGYIRRLGEARGKEKRVTEVKEVIKTWVVGGDDEVVSQSIPLAPKEDTGVRERKRKKETI